MIAAFIRQLGWTKPPAATDSIPPTAQDASHTVPVVQTAPETPQRAPAAPSLELEQVRRMGEDVAGLRQTIEQLSTAQDQMAHQIAKLQAANQQVLEKVSTPPPQVAVAPPHKLAPVPPAPPSRAPIPPH